MTGEERRGEGGAAQSFFHPSILSSFHPSSRSYFIHSSFSFLDSFIHLLRILRKPHPNFLSSSSSSVTNQNHHANQTSSYLLMPSSPHALSHSLSVNHEVKWESKYQVKLSWIKSATTAPPPLPSSPKKITISKNKGWDSGLWICYGTTKITQLPTCGIKCRSVSNYTSVQVDGEFWFFFESASCVCILPPPFFIFLGSGYGHTPFDTRTASSWYWHTLRVHMFKKRFNHINLSIPVR